MEYLLTEEMIRRTFSEYVDDEISIVMKRGAVTENYISYDWDGVSEDESIQTSFSVVLNFAKGTPESIATLDKMWESQNNYVDKDKDMESVSKVDRKASWSTLEGGQLRVSTDEYLFYFTLISREINKDNPLEIMRVWNKNYMIEKSFSLGKEVIEKL